MCHTVLNYVETNFKQSMHDFKKPDLLTVSLKCSYLGSTTRYILEPLQKKILKP